MVKGERLLILKRCLKTMPTMLLMLLLVMIMVMVTIVMKILQALRNHMDL
ncbi:unnamed protein product [Enterobius vermicularis]|uniref:Col_cuticle_N domain-containing protein n=1 Tax=Enterobius vermicularis TaxID=51028 RepID=A0A0N4VQV7_ENTVE|nr:unnamed protein product [Enterobius vermicularis]